MKPLMFTETLGQWGTPQFTATLKAALESLPTGSLPLESGLRAGGYVDDSDISVTVLKTAEDTQTIQAKLGIFFSEIVICCGCGDDPMPQNAYCQLLLHIDKHTARGTFRQVD